MSANIPASGAGPVAESVPQEGWQQWFQQIARRVNLLLQGKIQATGTVTLAASVGTTTITDSRIGPLSYIGLTATTAHAAAEIAGGALYVSAQAPGTATLTHANNAQADRTFNIVIIG